MDSALTPSAVTTFWRDAGRGAWFRADPAFDAAIAARFEAAHLEASRGAFDSWRDSAEGALALLLLFDQFPRNIYRGSAHAFATDPLARGVADHAIADGFDLVFDPGLQ